MKARIISCSLFTPDVIERVNMLALWLVGCLLLRMRRSVLADASPPPALLLPGLGGSQIEMKLDDQPHATSPLCKRTTSKYFRIWISKREFITEDCFEHHFHLTYNSTTRRTHNPQGVLTRVPGFGKTTTIERLDDSKKYYYAIAQMLVDDFGYVRGDTLFGAPYDFRKAPNEQAEYFANLKVLIEDKHNRTRKKVIVLCHSMGSMMAVYFLNHQTQEWKNEHILTLITMAGPWGGTVKALKVCVAGLVKPLWFFQRPLRKLLRTFPSVLFHLPSRALWDPDHDVLVTSPSQNYTINSFGNLFHDIAYQNGWEMYEDVRGLLLGLKAPGVELHCLYGDHVKTVDKLKFASTVLKDPHISYGRGDGTVNLRSLEHCNSWRREQSAPVYNQSFPNVDHMAMMTDKNVLDYIRKVIGSHTKKLAVSKTNSVNKNQGIFSKISMLLFLTIPVGVYHSRLR